MNYKFIRVITNLYRDVSEGVIYLVEAFDESGDIVNVKMSEEQIQEQQGDAECGSK